MKIKGFILLSGLVASLLVSCGQSAVKNAKLVTENDTLSYAIGLNLYRQLIPDSIITNPIVVAKALQDSKDDKKAMTDEQLQAFFMRFQVKMQETMMRRQAAAAAKRADENKVLYKANIAQGDSFLQKNRERSGVIVTESGLQYEVVKMGKGEKPTETSTVKVHYTGNTIGGTLPFDSSEGKDPAQFQVNGVIKGWTEVLQLMPVGSKFKVYIPESLAYGAEGAGDVIKPFALLIFDIELLEIVK